VTRRKRDERGNPVGTSNSSHLLDTRVFNVQFHDGHKEEYAANTIIENIYSQLNSNGERYLIMEETIDHKMDHNAIKIEDKYIQNGSNLTLHHTTKGWYLKVLWKDGTTSWEPLKDLKESNPIQVADYAIANNIVEEAAFAWWVPYTMKKRLYIMASIKARTTLALRSRDLMIAH